MNVEQLEEQKELYNSGAYVCYLFNSLSSKWLKPYWWDFHTDTYKLIHKKHEHIADAVIANPDVEVEWLIEPKGVTTAEDMFTPRWERRVRFFDTYEYDLKYRIKETKQDFKSDVKEGEEDGSNISELLHFNGTDITDSTDSSTSSGMGMEETISITDAEGVEYSFNTHGYEVKFYDLLENVIHGAIKCQGSWYSCEWSRFTGNSLRCTDEEVSEGDFNLNPIKPKWYECEDNFPVLMTNEESFQVVDLIEFDEYFRHWRLATRAELHSLYVEEK